MPSSRPGCEANTANSLASNTTPEQAQDLKELLLDRGWEFSSLPYALFKASGNKVSVAAYESGKLVVQGKEMENFVLYTLEPEILHTFTYQDTETRNAIAAAEEILPHGGIDESGKGDFFGPLVIAGVAVTPESGKALRELGVCDSKQIHSSAKILKRLYEKIGNLNRLLAWGHARVIENLLEMSPECPRMLSDKFGDESLIRRALMERGRKIIMDQQVRAEADVAVAAASILAREGFLKGMTRLAELTGMELPKGAGPGVKSAAAELFRDRGAEIFRSCAKLHFKTWHENYGLGRSWNCFPLPEILN